MTEAAWLVRRILKQLQSDTFKFHVSGGTNVARGHFKVSRPTAVVVLERPAA